MALDRFQPYLFVSAGEQSNKYLTPTYAGGIAKFQTQRAQAMSKLLVQIDPVQDLNGQANPYPPGGGKNKLENTAQTVTQSGVTFTVNEDGTVSTSGTSTENANHIVLGVMTLPAGDYVLSGCPSGGSASTFYIRINRGATASGAAGVRIATDTGSGAEFTLAEDTEICVWMSCDSGQVMNGKVFKPMIRLASVTDGTYAPYSNICPISGRTGMTVTRAGKNLLNPTSATSRTVSGVTFTKNADGSITASGTATATIWYDIISNNENAGYFPAGSYILHPTYNSNIDIRVAKVGSSVAIASAKQTAVPFTLTEGAKLYALMVVTNGTTVNQTFYPMVTTSAISDSTYAPYTATEYPITWETEAGTIYGGTLDLISGVLTVDKYYLTCADTITPGVGAYAYATSPNRWQISLTGDYMPSNEKMDESISDTFGYYNGGFAQWPDGTFRFSSISNDRRFIQFKWAGQPTTIDDLKALLAENPIHFVIPLATPETYQLDPEDVMTLAGFNQIYSDAGPVIDIQF